MCKYRQHGKIHYRCHRGLNAFYSDLKKGQHNITQDDIVIEVLHGCTQWGMKVSKIQRFVIFKRAF